jgi:DNA topoisomerase-2
VQEKPQSYIHYGKIERINDSTLSISELPVGKWTQDYKVFLEKMCLPAETKVKGKEAAAELKDMTEHHTETTVSFTVTAEKKDIDSWQSEKEGLCGKFKLKGTFNETNMVLFDTELRLQKYESPLEIMTNFFDIRADFYVERKALLVKKLEREQRMLSNKARFVEEVCNNDLVVTKRKRSDLLAELKERNYEMFAKEDKQRATDGESESDDEDTNATDAELAKGYEYLLGMKIWSLTFEKAESLRAQLAEKTKELAALQATEPNDIWIKDLDAIEAALDHRDEEIAKAVAGEKRAKKPNAKRQQAKMSKAKAGKKATEWDSDASSDDKEMDFDSDSEVEVVVAKPRAVPKVQAKPKLVPVQASLSALAAKKPVPLKSIPKASVAASKGLADDKASDSEDSTEQLPLLERISYRKNQNAKKRPSPKQDDKSEGDLDASLELDGKCSHDDKPDR